MINPQDIAHLSKDEQIELLLSLTAQGEARAAAAEAERDEALAAVSGLAAQLSELRESYRDIVEKLKLANQRRFAPKSEKVVPGQLALFNDMDAASDPEAAEPAVEDAVGKVAAKPRKRGGRRVVDWSKYETVVIEHELPADQRQCPECGGELEEMGIEVTRRIRIVPARVVVEEHRRRTYRCPACCEDNAAGGESKGMIVRAPQPAGPIPGSFATASLISWLINGKYVNALPLYRMEADLRAMDVEVSRQNMANWVMNVHARWLSKVHDRMRAELLSHDLAHADETVVQVLKEPNREPSRQSRMWLFCSSSRDVPVFIFRYAPTRSRNVAEDFLRGWSGTLTTDGYRPYFGLRNGGHVTNTACLVHVRRKFAEIVKVAGGDAKAAAAGSVALEARRLIDAMFAADSKFDGMAAGERKSARDEHLRPLMESFWQWLHMQLPKASPGLALHKALEYAIWCWPYMMNVLEDGRLELDNNIAERAIKPFVIGRKNWLFSNSVRGAEASAAVYSVVETAKANGLNPRKYVEWLLEQMPNAGELTDAVVDSFLPWSGNVPESCRMVPKAATKAAETADDPIVDIDRDVLDDEVANNASRDWEDS